MGGSARLPRALSRLVTSSRAVLWVGFGGLLALMLVVASSTDRALARLEASNIRIRRQLLQRDAVLDRLKADLYRSSIDIRDYLLNTDPQRAERCRAEVLKSEREMAAAFRQYRKDLPAPESAAVDELQRDLNSYFSAVEPVLRWGPETRRARGGDFISAQMLPRHEQLMRLAERIGSIDTRQLGAGETNAAKVFAGFRRELMAVALFTIAFGLAVAFLSVRRVQALERESEARYREAAGAREELHRLSARLVQAQEEERRHLSRELHDEVGADMSALLMELGSLASALPPDYPELHERLHAVRKLAEDNVGLVRNMALLLRPSMLDDLGLVPALQWQAREVARRSGVKIRVNAGEVSGDLPDDYRTCIYRVVQEALHNATRHARAAHVRITVRQEEAAIHVVIEDDGAGFDPRREKGMGILGMEERARHLGGALRIQSKPGSGAVVSLSLPFHQPVLKV